MIKPDPAIQQEAPEPIVFRCKRCRRILANKSYLLLHFVSKSRDDEVLSNLVENTHSQQMDQNLQKLLLTSIENSQSEKSQQETEVCADAYFFEPIAWMTDIANHTQGSLNCPKCKAKLGKFNWIMSSKCPCGKQVSKIFTFLLNCFVFTEIYSNRYNLRFI